MPNKKLENFFIEKLIDFNNSVWGLSLQGWSGFGEGAFTDAEIIGKVGMKVEVMWRE